jgi:hypothetical protein
MMAVAQLKFAPGHWVHAFAAAEQVTEVRLVAEPAFLADLRQAQGGAGDQHLGLLDALLANPFLGRYTGGALEGPGEMAAGQLTGASQFRHLQGASKIGEDQLLDPLFPL